MTLKEMLGFAAPVLTGGAVIILGFLSFSGIYVLWPILSVCILGFFLSVGFEGAIYYENIKNALEKLFRPNYLKRQLAHECLREIATKIELREQLTHIINTLQSSDDHSQSLMDDYADFLDLFEQFTERDDFERKQKLESNLLSLDEFREKTKMVPVTQDERDQVNQIAQNITFATKTRSKQAHFNALPSRRNISSVRIKLKSLLADLGKTNDTPPPFFDDFVRLTKLHHKYDKPRLIEKNQIEKDELDKSIKRLKKLFRDQLFLDSNAPKVAMIGTCIEVVATNQDEYKYSDCEYVFIEESGNIYKKNEKTPLNYKEMLRLRTTRLSDAGKKSLDDLIYTNQLSRYLNSHRVKWQAKLEERRYLFMIVQAVSSLAGVCMILGTTFLLVEAFAVLPFISLIPLGFWPILIMPMAVIAGLAFGLLTYNAITDMINNDVILKRYYKIKADLKKGVTFSSGLMIVATVSLFAITIALTVCTAGTWWTVIKHTRPLFVWMGKIPAVLIGIVSATLAFATLMFNWVNSDQTLTEFSEMDTDAKPHDYDLMLISVDVGIDLPKPVGPKPTLIKRGDEYWLCGCNDGKTWTHTQINGDFSKSIDFTQKILPYSITNAAIYFTIILNRAHTFIPIKENYWQIFNPFRFILIVTYMPLLGVLFIGHLISIAATSDRLPSVNELISMAVGFGADFVEDFTYIFSLEPRHRDDIGSLMDEQASGGHNHDDNLPSWTLRKLFYPLFYLAAWWHSAMSKREKNGAVLSDDNMYDVCDVFERDTKTHPSVSFAEALEQMQGIKPAEEVVLKSEDQAFMAAIHPDSGDDEIDVITRLAKMAVDRISLPSNNGRRSIWASCSRENCNHLSTEKLQT